MENEKSALRGVPEALVGVFIFSLTAPTMRLALESFDVTVVGLGRIVIAAIPSVILLALTGRPRLTFAQFRSLLVVTACLAFGFSGLIALALKHVASHHAGIVIGGIPLATALFATLRNRQRQGAHFWVAALAGSLIVVAYGFLKSGGRFTSADLILLLAAGVCGLGYAEGSRLGQQIGTRTVTCLVPLVAAPIAIFFCLGKLPEHPWSVPTVSWLALLYNGLFSTFIGFLFWYRGLALGGIARIGQVQLLQPFFTLAASAFMLGEPLSVFDWLSAGGVVACVAVTQSASTRKVRDAETLAEPSRI